MVPTYSAWMLVVSGLADDVAADQMIDAELARHSETVN
jgi:hypothetical protein